ncbi:MAG: TonB-dependent receptor plug domain-containing protein [Chitinispirillaceae bacterium]
MNLDRMVVTASKSSMSADLVVEDVEVATKRQIESGGFFNAMEMLDGILGVDIDPARTQTNIVLNGLKGEYVKILIDGIPFTGNGRRGISSRGRY